MIYHQLVKLGELRLCSAAFRETLGLPERTLRHWQKKFEEEENSETFKTRSALKASVTAAWLSTYARNSGDAQPDKPVYHLPATLWKKDVYNEFVATHAHFQHVIPSQVCAFMFNRQLLC